MKRNSLLFKKLEKIYKNPKDCGSLGGVDRLFESAKSQGIKGLNKKLVKEFLSGDRAYSHHKRIIKKIARNKTIVKGIDSQWQADLVDMQAFAEENDGIKYLLTSIDIFSKYSWVVPIKDKSTKEMIIGFRKLFTISSPRKPEKLQTDKGTEFLNEKIQSLLSKEFGIKHFTTMGETKCSLVERFHRTIKDRIWRFLTNSRTTRYIDILDDIIYSYNNSYHRSIKMKPVDVKKSDETLIWRRLYGDGQENGKSKFQIGDIVRIPKWKGEFARGYEPNWTEEEFRVKEISSLQQPNEVYKLEDMDNEPIIGSFYSKQLQKIKPSN
ncbi:MAG: putative uncharacterized transposon-derived protein F54H12.3-like [Ignavibacteria bacterium]|nr:MAG: putative uncharacterized transposon-derived protein F54H12.3-like [Ignavibacteria bacterium]